MDLKQPLYRSKLGHRLSLRFALIVIAFSALFVVLSTTLQLFLGYRNDVALIQDNVQFVEQSYLPSIADSLYKLDEDQLRLLLKGVLQLRGIDYCDVQEEQQAGIYRVIEGQYPNVSDIVRHFPLVYHNQRGESVAIGTLTVVASFESARARLLDNAHFYIGSSALEIFVTAFVVLVLFQRLVARHMATMAKYTQTLDIDNLEPSLTLDRSSRQDELDQVANAINDLRIRLQQDMAERKQAEVALKASHDRFQAVMDSLDAAVYVADMQSYEVLFVNQYGQKRWGDVVGKTCWQTLQAGQNTPCAFCTNEKLVDKNGESTGIYVWESQNTLDQQWYECRDQAIRWPDGRLVRLEIATNITERKQAEKEREHLTAQVRAQAQQMEQILATVPMGVLLLDASGQILQANPIAEKDLGVLAGAKVGDVLTQLGDRPLSELLTSPPTKGLWHEVKADCGQSPRTFEVVARLMTDEATLQQWVMVINDITREREIQVQLQQQERLAAVGQLAAGIAHDFNNIMAVIVLYAQMGLRAPDISPKLHKRLEIVVQQAKRATNLIQQILDFSRQAVLERRPLALMPFLKELIKLLQRTVPEHITINLTYGTGEYVMNADPTRLQQAIMNLVVNARDAMPEGGVLQFDLSRIVDTDEARCVICGEVIEGDWLRLTVTDTGTGIPPNVLPHIFEPFYTTKEAGKGTGLGLAQVYGVVAQHEGHLSVATKVAQGTTFSIYLPELKGQQTEALATETPALTTGQGETILLVEDDATLRAAIAESLTAQNYYVLEAAHGREALNLLEQYPQDIALVLSDLVMPEMGGQALFREVQQLGLTIPVVLLSGHPMEKELRTLQAQGLAGWMRKPPDMEHLSRLLAQALQEIDRRK